MSIGGARIQNVAQRLTKDEAEHVVSTLAGDPEDDWTYRIVLARTAPEPFNYYVEAYDEDGEFVGRL